MFGKKKTEEVKKEEQKYTWQQNVALYLHDMICMLVAVMAVLMLFLRIIVVDGPSMERTLLNGDYMLLVSNMFYKEPKHGDVVVVSKQAYDNGKPSVKRVIATEGQTVDIDFNEGVVYVDGVAQDEPYTKTLTTLKEGTEFPLVVEEGKVFVMGDNRNNSKDSRNPMVGALERKMIKGHVRCVVFPLNKARIMEN